MADVLSKLGESLKTTLKEATEQTQKSVDQVGCRTDLLNKRNELKKLFESLGEAQYKVMTDENEDAANRDALSSIHFSLRIRQNASKYKILFGI